MGHPNSKTAWARGFLVIFLALIFSATSGEYVFASGAKALFYDEGDVSVRTASDKVPQKKKKAVAQKKEAAQSESYLGLSYWVDLIDRQGNSVRTTTSRVFQSGDRIKLNLKSNRNGYLYVVGVGSSGSSRVLFPNAEGVANGIKAKVTYAVPFDTNLKFDDTPGEEKLLVLLSERPIPQIVPGQKNIPTNETKLLVASAHVPGSKDLVLEEEVPESAIEPASFAVVPVSALGGKGTLTLQIKLKHK